MIDYSLPVQLDKLSEQRAGLLLVAYWLRGRLMNPPRVGAILIVSRFERAAQTEGEVAPVKVAGLYTSSPVVELIDNEDGSVTARTQNSCWKISQYLATE